MPAHWESGAERTLKNLGPPYDTKTDRFCSDGKKIRISNFSNLLSLIPEKYEKLAEA